MPISDWFKAREGTRYTPTVAPTNRGELADGAWTKCESCKHIAYEGELDSNRRVCRHCGHHIGLTAHQRIDLLCDAGSFEEMDPGLTSVDTLEFVSTKPYTESLERAREASGLPEAVVTGRASIGGHDVVIAAMDFRFVAASMGSVVGEKITRAFERAAEEDRAVVVAAASGGARMQEGMLSLMQMAKTSAAAGRLAAQGLPYVSILCNPTTGGVSASFATLADVIIAEPGALIGFTGPRVIEQTIRQKPPKGFQSSEFQLEHGMVDMVVERSELTEILTLVLDYLCREGGDRS